MKELKEVKGSVFLKAQGSLNFHHVCYMLPCAYRKQRKKERKVG